MPDKQKTFLRQYMKQILIVFAVFFICVSACCVYNAVSRGTAAGETLPETSYKTRYGYGLYVDDVFVAACDSYQGISQAIDKTVSGLADAFGAPDDGIHTLKNDVRIVSGRYRDCDFADGIRVASLLGVRGDTVSFEVCDVNNAVLPLALRVETTLNRECFETIARPVVRESTDLLETGTVAVVDEGADGQALNTYGLVYINGELTEETLFSSTVVKQPETRTEWTGSDTGATLLEEKELFALPYNGRISSPYGYRRLFGRVELHNGIDLVALSGGCYGDPIYAAQDGIVSFAGRKGGYGNAVIIDHTKSVYTLYAHCSKLIVNEGDTVRKGQLIALIGNTGRVTGAHLHFSLFIDGKACDPSPYIDWTGFRG